MTALRQINALMSEALLHIERAKFWRHRGLIYPSAAIYLADGIHFNEGGNRALYKSYRGAILLALSQLRKYQSLHWYVLMYIFLGEFLVLPFVIPSGYFARCACELKSPLNACTAIIIYCNTTRGACGLQSQSNVCPIQRTAINIVSGGAPRKYLNTIPIWKMFNKLVTGNIKKFS